MRRVSEAVERIGWCLRLAVAVSLGALLPLIPCGIAWAGTPELAVHSPSTAGRVHAYSGDSIYELVGEAPLLPRVFVRYTYTSRPSQAGSTRVTLKLLRDGAVIVRSGPFWVPDGTTVTRTDAVRNCQALDSGWCDLAVEVRNADGATSVSEPDAVYLYHGGVGAPEIESAGSGYFWGGDWISMEETTASISGSATPGETVRLFVSPEPETPGTTETALDETVAVAGTESDPSYSFRVHLSPGRYLVYTDVVRGSVREVSPVVVAEINRWYDEGAHLADLSGWDVLLDLDDNSNGGVSSMRLLGGHFPTTDKAFDGGLMLQVAAGGAPATLAAVSRHHSTEEWYVGQGGQGHLIQNRLAIDGACYVRRHYRFGTMEKYLDVLDRYANPSGSLRSLKASYDSTSGARSGTWWLASFRSGPFRVTTGQAVLAPPLKAGYLVSCDRAAALGRAAVSPPAKVAPAPIRPVEFIAWKRPPAALILKPGGRSRLNYSVVAPAAAYRDVQLYAGVGETTKQAVALAKRLTVRAHAGLSAYPLVARRGRLVRFSGHVFPPYPGTMAVIVGGPSLATLKVLKQVYPNSDGYFWFRRRVYASMVFYVWWQDPYSHREVFSPLVRVRVR